MDYYGSTPQDLHDPRISQLVIVCYLFESLVMRMKAQVVLTSAGGAVFNANRKRRVSTSLRTREIPSNLIIDFLTIVSVLKVHAMSMLIDINSHIIRLRCTKQS